MLNKIKKILGALNIFKKIEQVLIDKVIAKGVKATVQAILGMAILDKLEPAGVTIDFTKLETWLIAVGTGLVASLWNWIKKRYDFQK